MLDFSFGELAVIGAVALVVLGPERLPKVARTVGDWVGKAQRYVNQVKTDINREMELSELSRRT
jgi:sec-independent protein translocase protein TatB